MRARVRGGSAPGRSDRFHRWRRRTDRIARWLIALGGVSVIVAVVLILFYLIYVVFPLFLPASADRVVLGARSAWADGQTAFLAIEEQQQVVLRVSESGVAEFVSLPKLESVPTIEFPYGQAPRTFLDDLGGNCRDPTTPSRRVDACEGRR